MNQSSEIWQVQGLICNERLAISGKAIKKISLKTSKQTKSDCTNQLVIINLY
jgi:hypothetical protein